MEYKNYMKKLLVISITVMTVLMMIHGLTFAQGTEPVKTGNIDIARILTWANATPPDWTRGALFSVFGLVGALVTMFSLIGGAVPGIAGQALIDVETNQLGNLYKRLEQLINASTIDAEAINAIEKTINDLRNDLRVERWRQFGIALIFYALLGSFFAAILAQDLLQALVIGAGWTGVVGNLGLKKDHQERASRKDAALDQMEKLVTSQQQAIETIQKIHTGSKESGSTKVNLSRLMNNIRIPEKVPDVLLKAKSARIL